MDAREAKRRRQTILLGALGVILAGVVVLQLWPARRSAETNADPRARTARGAAAGRRGEGAATSTPGVPQVVEVRVARLQEEPPAVSDTGRNPFRFRPKPAP